MVRFHWHVEDGFGAFIPPGGMAFHKDTGVQHATTEIEIPGQNQLATALMTVPAGYLQEGKMQKVGVVIGHGLKAEDWKGELLTELAASLAKAGKQGLLPEASMTQCRCSMKSVYNQHRLAL